MSGVPASLIPMLICSVRMADVSALPAEVDRWHFVALLSLNDHHRLQVFAGLPVVFVAGGPKGWTEITCDAMEEHAKTVATLLQQSLQPGNSFPPFQFEKLTLRYWEHFVRERVWAAGAAYAHGVGNKTVMPVVSGYSTQKDVRQEMVVGPQPT